MPDKYTAPRYFNLKKDWLKEDTATQRRFWSKVFHRNNCWIFEAGIDRDGYGRFGINRKTHFAHRLSYESYKGPIPEGMTIDHLCRVRNCVNPNHLEAVTHRENVNRGQLKLRHIPKSVTISRSQTA